VNDPQRAVRAVVAVERGELPELLGAAEVAELIKMPLEWVASRRYALPCFEVPSDDGTDSIVRMRIRREDLHVWAHDARYSLREVRAQ
jgi:hypothetical protein